MKSLVSLKSERSPVHGEEAGGAHFVLPRDRVWPQDGGIVAEDNLSGGDAASGHQEPVIIALQTSPPMGVDNVLEVVQG